MLDKLGWGWDGGTETAVSEWGGEGIGTGWAWEAHIHPLGEASSWGPPFTLAQAPEDDGKPHLTSPKEADPGEDSILMTI